MLTRRALASCIAVVLISIPALKSIAAEVLSTPQCESLFADLSYSFYPEGSSNRTHYYQPTSWALIELMAKKPSDAFLAATRSRIDAFETRAKRFNWFELLEGLRKHNSAAYDALQSARLKSNTVQRDERYRAKWERAEKTVRGWAKRGKKLDLDSIIEINELVGFPQVHADRPPGTLRYRPTIDDFTDPSFSSFLAVDVRRGMTDLLQWYNENSDRLRPIELATLFYQRFTTIHPFVDGNGRTGRLILDWILMGNGLPPATFLTDRAALVNRSTVAGRDTFIEDSISAVFEASEYTFTQLTTGGLALVGGRK